ncbi:MAG TPA: regulatory iron-sulfur-containing complex subunit RicT [Thermoleophilia bacterium]|mgnify:CR=1 FL=1|nr:regulatory iron-sulfur-containing complex subunit RicT [Thermoleophilia bacterium]HQG04124.1 regulatory iron-sulfur-containing complex subunit RicT [Thermoleophilia bacterium]HQG54741.1 regulatory iron-sulfur-containing complex subunit RicT [Thermoleophilia bacterium]HQJ97682.1 regulatory iron-sulfur-containing complex subunit RicT [Thermoleophilia bacterium]
MPDIASVVFRGGGKVYEFDAGGLELSPGDKVVVETARGADLGTVVRVTHGDEGPPGGLKKVRRRATAADLERLAANCAAEDEAKAACRELARELGLDMKVVGAEQSFEGGKLTVTFFAEDRVDFRRLVVKLSDRLGRRVELKQVGARDEARSVGGYGPCGRSLCCATFAGDQQPVSIRMAKDQSLPLNPSKISGCCGRLMCCLKYEHAAYVSFRQCAPRRGTVVTTPVGEGRVIELLAPAESVVVDLGEGRTATYRLSELGPEGGKEERS